MKIETEIYSEMVGYIGKTLRDHFGKGPTSVYITLKKPFITIYLRDFIIPIERVLIDRNEIKRVEETRDLVMDTILPDIKQNLCEIAQVDIDKIYYNWSLVNHSGMIFGTIKTDETTIDRWPDHLDLVAFRQEINVMTKKGQLDPENTEIFWLSERTILSKRKGIFSRIEKELIKKGYIEQLKLAKRPMEKQLVKEANLESVLQKKIQDIFVDWDIQEDTGYIVLVTE